MPLSFILPARRNRQTGVTAIELLLVLIIAGILVALGLPSFRAMVEENRVNSASNDLVTTMNLARSEAITRNATVALCATIATAGSDFAAATPVCQTDNAATGWESGWILFVDADNDGAYDAGEEILRRQAPMAVLMSGNANVDDHFSYTATGRSNANGTISVCPVDGGATSGKGNDVVLSTTGRARTEDKNDCP